MDCAALRHNLAALRTHSPNVGIMAVVKANAYGHGLAPVVDALAGRVEIFGVANLAEAREAAHHAGRTPIFLLGAALPSERAQIVSEGFISAVSSIEEAAAFSKLSTGAKVRVHLVVDTGMGRMGVCESDALAVAERVFAMPGIEVAGVCSHLPVADDDDAFTSAQLTRFHALVAAMRERGLPADALIHIENSAGFIAFPERAGALVRAGLTIYGVAPRAEFQSKLRPALTWKTRVLFVRNFIAGRGVSYGRTFTTPTPMRIATLAVGYADGYPRQLSGRGASVLIRGCRCAVLGRVTMDQIMVDATALPDLAPGEEAVLLGRQGGEEIPANDLAERACTIAWDIFTGIGTRVMRVPFDSAVSSAPHPH